MEPGRVNDSPARWDGPCGGLGRDKRTVIGTNGTAL